MYKRYADGSHKLELRKLQHMITTSKTPDDDFKRAFVLFTTGAILAPTTQIHVHWRTINWSYIQVVRKASVILKFNWGQFTLTHLLDSFHNYRTWLYCMSILYGITNTYKQCLFLVLRIFCGNLAQLHVSSIWYNQHL